MDGKKYDDLSDDDKKKRDLYLRDLAIGKIQGPPVGFASIDKPWLGSYSEKDILSDISYKRMYEEFRDNCLKYRGMVADELWPFFFITLGMYWVGEKN